jgi:hypothetical protein
MEPTRDDEIQRIPEEALTVIEIGRVSEETKGISPGSENGPFTGHVPG